MGSTLYTGGVFSYYWSMRNLGIYEYGHMIHRAWRYRLNTERDEVCFMLAQDLKGKTVVDIGANTGIYSYWMHKKVGAKGRVIGFEPQPEMIEHLKKVRQAFKLRNLEIAPTGLSSTTGTVTLKREMNHLGGASISFDLPNADDSITIPITTLDEYFCNHPARPISFIKCDVEGHESEVIAGGMEIIKRDLPTMLIECHNRIADESPLFEHLIGIGYRAHFFYKRRLVPFERVEELRSELDKPFLNYVFLPPTAS